MIEYLSVLDEKYMVRTVEFCNFVAYSSRLGKISISSCFGTFLGFWEIC